MVDIDDEMKPCPWCKGTNLRVKPVWREYHFVACLTCKAAGPVRKTHDQAIAAWNKRSDHTCVAGRDYCSNCYAFMNKGAKYCSSCGAEAVGWYEDDQTTLFPGDIGGD